MVEEYVDPNISASRAKKRAAYERMLADIKLGLIDGIVCKNQDRLARNLTELAALVRLTREHNIAILLLDDEIDTSTADGRLKMHILGAVAENEADKLSERVKQQRERAALAGTYTGGRRPFGYESDGMTIVKDEAKHVRAMVKNYLAGMAINRIAIVLNHLLVQGKAPKPTRAKMWSTTSVRSIIMNPRYAGLYTRKGKVSNVPAAWPAIISPEQHEQVIEKLGAPRTPKRGRKPVAMLSGVLVCSRCGGAMTSGVGSNGIKRYSCSKLPNNNGCGRMSVVAGYTEWWVSQMIFTALEGAVLPAPPHAGDDVDRELADIEERLRQLALDYGNGSLDHDEWVASRSALKLDVMCSALCGTPKDLRRSCSTSAACGSAGRRSPRSSSAPSSSGSSSRLRCSRPRRARRSGLLFALLIRSGDSTRIEQVRDALQCRVVLNDQRQALLVSRRSRDCGRTQ